MVEIVKRPGIVSAAKIVLCAIAAILVLCTWFVDPAMSGEIRDVGPLLFWLLMISVVVAAICVLIIGPDSDKG